MSKRRLNEKELASAVKRYCLRHGYSPQEVRRNDALFAGAIAEFKSKRPKKELSRKFSGYS